MRAKIKGLEMARVAKSDLEFNANVSTQNSSAPNQTEAFEVMTFEEVLQEQVLLESSPSQITTLVCLFSNPENQQVILKTIQGFDPGTKVVFISSGSSYRKESRTKYTIVKGKGATYGEAFKSIGEDHGEVDAVLYLWALEDSNCIRDPSCIVLYSAGHWFVQSQTEAIVISG